MRLINTTTLQLETFLGAPPPYCILSHRWEEEEVSFQDMTTGKGRSMKGFAKIESCTYFARESGFDYIWVDTCCIDKTSSAELTEAINSMFNWYRESEKCLVYMYDVGSADEFAASQWFTRGWTLQELIAPKKVDFLSKDWKPLGDRSSRKDDLVKVTRISEEVLMGLDLAQVPACQKMAWASNRQTTKAEDLAYCMMGLFNVNMPLLYGEGEEKAFLRLQEQFLKDNDDESILAWTMSPEEAAAKPHWGLLATSPKYFADAHTYTIPKYKAYREGSAMELTNNGLKLSLVVQPLAMDKVEMYYLAALNCCRNPDDSDNINSSFSITLQRLSNIEPQFARVRPEFVLPLKPDFSKAAKPLRAYTRGFDRQELELSRLFVRAMPRVTNPVAGFCINGVQKVDFYWRASIGGVIGNQPAHIEFTFDGYDKDRGSTFSAMDMSAAEAKRGKGIFDPATLKGKQVVGCWQLKVTSWEDHGVAGRGSSEITMRAGYKQPYLVVGLESLPDTPLDTPAAYLRPWYSFAESDDEGHFAKLLDGSVSPKLTQLAPGPAWFKVEFEPAMYAFRTYWDVRVILSDDED